MRKKIILGIYSLSYFLIWGLGFMDSNASLETAALALIYSGFSFGLLVNHYNFQLNKKDQILVLSIPIFYTLLYSFSHFHKGVIHFISNPFSLALILVTISTFSAKKVRTPFYIFFIAFASLFYSANLFLQWKKGFNVILESFDAEISIKSNTVNDKKNPFEAKANSNLKNLVEFNFININLDTIKLENKYTLIETWNETCPPCLRAFKDLNGFYEINNDLFDSYYLYENNKEESRRLFNEIFNFKYIPKKSKILIDINQDLYSSFSMKGFPYFVLFNPSGELIFNHYGYKEDQYEYLTEQILLAIKKDRI